MFNRIFDLLRSRGYIYVAVFAAGVTTLAIEVSALRLLGNVFGTANFVWAAIIGAVLFYLAVGNYAGGMWADRVPSADRFYELLAWAAIATGVLPLVSRPVLLWSAAWVAQLNGAVAAGAFAGALLLLAAPLAMLGAVTPFAVRLLLDDATRAGKVAGRVYAVSTAGSLLGCFLPVLLVIPAVGTRLTFILFAGLLVAVALGGLAARQPRRAMWLLLLAVLLGGSAAWLARAPAKPVAGLQFETESAYNLIQVVRRNGIRYLLLNEGQGIHSILDPNQAATGGTWDYFLTAPYFVERRAGASPVERVAIVGLAAGTIARQYTLAFGAVPIDGIELDAEIVAVGRNYFELTQPNLNVIIGDGRWVLAHSSARYSVVLVDAYRLPYIPAHLTTAEFFREVKAHLAPDGALAVNVGRAPKDRRLVDAIATTLASVFASVHIMDVPRSLNSVLVATLQPTQSTMLQRNLDALPAGADPLLRAALAAGVQALQPAAAPGMLFTDDHAPIEQLTDSILLRFLLQANGAGLDS